MSDDIPGVAERLAHEFPDLPPIEVMRAVSDCADECEHASGLFVEHAARARISDGRSAHA